MRRRSRSYGMTRMPGMPPPLAQYKIAVSGQVMGPFDLDTLTSMVRNGQLTPQTQVWRQGMTRWTSADSIKELKGIFSQTKTAPEIQYSVAVNGQTTGPFGIDALAKMAQSGQLNSQSQVWKQGMSGWVSAGTVQELSGFFAGASAPSMSSSKYQVAANGQTTGPFDMNTLAEMARNGRFFPQSQVWKQGMSGWVSADTVQELNELLAQNAVPNTWEDYHLPIDGILNECEKAECTETPPPIDGSLSNDENIQNNITAIEETLWEFKIEAKVTGVCKGPVLTMYEILPAPGVKLSKITALEDNIALRLASRSLRILAPIPGKQAVGIEAPNKIRETVSFREIIETSMDACEKDLPLYLGKTISGEPITADLTSMPHVLVAGTTGSGKSVCINSMILSLLYCLSPAECRMIFIDAKVVELKFYDGIPHLLTPVITDPKRALAAMRYCVNEMERRYEQLANHSSRNIKSYNNAAIEKGMEIMPYIVVIIDEFADLMSVSGKELEALITRLAAKSRAVGIHLVLATQRPSVNVITGIIKANIPARIAFMVASNVDSRVILDSPGAEKLLGKGDMLFSGSDPFPVRAQGAFVSDEEAEKVVAHLKTLGSPVFVKF